VPVSIPGTTRFPDKYRVWNGIQSASLSITEELLARESNTSFADSGHGFLLSLLMLNGWENCRGSGQGPATLLDAAIKFTFPHTGSRIW
jgi:hypothetical protein